MIRLGFRLSDWISAPLRFLINGAQPILIPDPRFQVTSTRDFSTSNRKGFEVNPTSRSFEA